MEMLTSLLGRSGYLPHGYCFTWTPGLLWSMVAADAIIALAYFSIPLAMASFVRKRSDTSMNGVMWLFIAFIFACGVTHVMDIWTIWQPDYALQTLTKVVTAVISLITAIALWPLIPKALKIPSVASLQAAIASLENEVRKRISTEEHLRDVQQSLSVTLSSIGAGFIATDREGKVVRMNAVAEQVMGWRQDEAAGHGLWEVFQREDRPASYAKINPVDLVIERGLTVEIAHHFVAISRSGQRTAIELKADLTHADDGTVKGMVMVFRDETELLRAAAEESRLAAIVESSFDAIIAKTLDGRITNWNEAAENLFGYRAEEAIGQSIYMLIPEDRHDEELRIITELSHGTRVAPFDTQRLAKDGSLLDVSVTTSPIRDGQGRIIGASKIVRDISPQRRAEEARLNAQRLEAENRQIQEANRLKSQFLANMSHELRTPLNAIIGFADLLHAGVVPPGSPKHPEFLGHIGASGRHLLKLINDVLDLSKVESGKFEFAPEPVRLAALTGEVTGILLTSTRNKRIAIQTEIDAGLDDLVLDPARLKQVLYNYLSNAIKFTPEGGRVVIRALPVGATHFRMEVEDSGIGIAEADLSRLFIEFQQLDSGYGKHYEGTGLGLALTRRLVEAQGGSVGVRSTPGKGSVFHFVLKRRHEDLAVTPFTQRGRRLLVIENEAERPGQLARGLEDAGFEVDGASTGAQALAKASKHAYDAMTLSLTLPDQAGLDALAKIRDRSASRASPVVGVSMQTGEGASAAFSVADVLSKPIRGDEIASTMTRFTREAGHISGRAKVMVIDDDPLALDLMGATLMGIGIEAVCLQEGRMALKELSHHRPDAIILDLMMPEFDGFAVLDALQRLPEWRHTPVFIWTSMTLSEQEYALLARSAEAILAKGGGSLAPMIERLRLWRPMPDPKAN